MEYVITFQPYCIEVIFGFKKTINLRICKASITAEEPRDVRGSVTGNDWFQNALPVVGTMNISIAKKCSLYITELVKAKYRVITGTAKIPIVGRTFLITIGRAYRAV